MLHVHKHLEWCDQVPSGEAMVGFEWGKQDLSVHGNGTQQQQQPSHSNGSNGHHEQHTPKVQRVAGRALSVCSCWPTVPNHSQCYLQDCILHGMAKHYTGLSSLGLACVAVWLFDMACLMLEGCDAIHTAARIETRCEAEVHHQHTPNPRQRALLCTTVP